MSHEHLHQQRETVEAVEHCEVQCRRDLPLQGLMLELGIQEGVVRGACHPKDEVCHAEDSFEEVKFEIALASDPVIDGAGVSVPPEHYRCYHCDCGPGAVHFGPRRELSATGGPHV